MFLALREIRAARGRFLLMGSVVVLVAALVGIVSGFTTGLGNDTISALRGLPASHLAFASDVRSDQFNRSLVDRTALDAWRDRDGTDATPLGVSLTRGTTDRGTDVDLAAFGMEPGSFLEPAPREGKPLGSAPDGIVISQDLADEGVRVGDVLTIDRLDIDLPVTGTADAASYGHVPAAYLPLDTWQKIRFGAPGARKAKVPDEFSGVALRTGDEPEATAGTTAIPKEKVYEAAPGYTGERVTMTSIQFFLFLMAPLVVGAFFAVWTVQRGPELALLRALGAARRTLLAQTVLQAATVVVAGALVGGVLAAGVGLLVGAAVPFSLPLTTLAGTLAAVTAAGLAGAALTLRRVTAPDPLVMLGAAR